MRTPIVKNARQPRRSVRAPGRKPVTGRGTTTLMNTSAAMISTTATPARPTARSRSILFRRRVRRDLDIRELAVHQLGAPDVHVFAHFARLRVDRDRAARALEGDAAQRI